jgi:hypothetical protein
MAHVIIDKGSLVIDVSMGSIGRSAHPRLSCLSTFFLPYALNQGASLLHNPRGSRQHAFTTMEEGCCTCATLLKNILPQYVEKSEKPKVDRRLDCCGRVICGNCTAGNPRFATYCWTSSESETSTAIDKIQVRSAKYPRPQLLYLRVSATLHLTPRPPRRSPHHFLKIYQPTPTNSPPTLHSRILGIHPTHHRKKT